MNIAVNSLEAMPRGGHIVFRTGAVDEDWCFLEIQDSGPGIPAEDAQRVFEPFYTTKGVDRSSGLGLSVVHGIVTRWGGDVTVDSEIGKGTTIRVRLPSSPWGATSPRRSCWWRMNALFDRASKKC